MRRERGGRGTGRTDAGEKSATGEMARGGGGRVHEQAEKTERPATVKTSTPRDTDVTTTSRRARTAARGLFSEGVETHSSIGELAFACVFREEAQQTPGAHRRPQLGGIEHSNRFDRIAEFLPVGARR